MRSCTCSRPHYPLRFFKRDGYTLATRGVKPVENIISEGWEEDFAPSVPVMSQLHFQYDRSHRFDWFHTPTYLDDRETHLRMKAQTAR